MSTLDIVVGAQFGSEAKGHVTKRVLQRLVEECICTAPIINVRVAGPNAGHCVLDSNGQKFAMRSLPVGFVFPTVMLWIAPGSEIEPEVLFGEIEEAERAGHKISGRLVVSGEATILTNHHKAVEVGMHERIGSTGKGIGAARADRIMRKAQRVKDDPFLVDELQVRGIEVTDKPIPCNAHVIIEGTQGYGLGLHAGHYPQCTSSNTRAIDFAAMAGLNPWDFDDFAVWAVARVYPIRVAGNSGPLKDETSWDELGLPEELTTVTKKVRRVGHWDADLVREAVRANGVRATTVALTMVDQKFPDAAGLSNVDSGDKTAPILDEAVLRFIQHVQVDAGARVSLVTTGEDTGVWMR